MTNGSYFVLMCESKIPNSRRSSVKRRLLDRVKHFDQHVWRLVM